MDNVLFMLHGIANDLFTPSLGSCSSIQEKKSCITSQLK